MRGTRRPSAVNSGDLAIRTDRSERTYNENTNRPGVANARILVLLTLFTMLTGAACNKAADTPGNTKATPANAAVAVNPTTRHT
jgi:hypothetical protein